MGRQLRICAIGYYGYRNAGDDLLRTAIEYVFSGHQITTTCWVPDVAFLNQFDLVVVGGGSIWPGFTIFQHGNAFARELRKPLMILGISAKSPNSTVRDQTLALARKARLVFFRDHETSRIMEFGDMARVKPDLFWWMPWRAETDSDGGESNSVAVNLRDWQGMTWSPRDLVGVLTRKGYRVSPVPFAFGDPATDPNTRCNDVQLATELGLPDVPTNWLPGRCAESRFTVAMRFHAVLVAIRSGRPVISFNYHRKLSAFFSEAGIAELCVPLTDPAALGVAVDRLEQNYDRYRARFEQIRKDLELQGEAAAQQVRAATAEIAEGDPEKPTLVKRVARRLLSHVV